MGAGLRGAGRAKRRGDLLHLTVDDLAQCGLLGALNTSEVGPQLGEAFLLRNPTLSGLLRLEGTGDATPVRKSDAEVVTDLLHDLLAPIVVRCNRTWRHRADMEQMG